MPLTRMHLIAFALLPVLGCGPGRASLKGQVTYQGKALTSGSVVLISRDGTVLSSPIDTNGKYEINNLPVGHARVAVSSPQPGVARKSPSSRPDKQEIPPTPGDASKWFPIPENYREFDKSELTYELKSGVNQWDIELK